MDSVAKKEPHSGERPHMGELRRNERQVTDDLAGLFCEAWVSGEAANARRMDRLAGNPIRPTRMLSGSRAPVMDDRPDLLLQGYIEEKPVENFGRGERI